MNKQVANFWNDRYIQKEFVYGTQPNAFYKQQLDKIKPGSILLPAEGEGRNAVYAASQGWDVSAFDISQQGKEKAVQLAKQLEVTIDYKVAGVLDFETTKPFDVIGLSYAHFPVGIRKEAHLQLLTFLKPNGIVIFEAFAKAQLGKPSGGPKNIEMLFSIQEIKNEFPELDFKLLKEETITLAEGNYHKGTAEVIRFMGIKK